MGAATLASAHLGGFENSTPLFFGVRWNVLAGYLGQGTAQHKQKHKKKHGQARMEGCSGAVWSWVRVSQVVFFGGVDILTLVV
ncbi:hypothetical protein HYQ46_010642 [Verticillium longisporum]|nr:hypothetical protein HYQ46_010642 [Verticillium longisporum]